jgi:hypothetical protein
MQSALKHISSALPFLIILFLCSDNTQAQPGNQDLPAPPPMRFLSHDDRSQLAAAKDAKARIRITIELADAHLAQMEELTSRKMFDEASATLGNYMGLIEDVMHFVGEKPQDKNDTRDLYRHLDIALRAQLPRLAVMRRATPSDYSIYLKAAEEFIRDTRAEALDSFYGHTVLREESTKKQDARNASPDNKRP